MGPSRLTLAVLVLLGLINLVRGAIHLFLPDGGAGVIAGLDLSTSGQTIVFLFAGIGAGQIAAGVTELAVILRYRAFALPLLVIETGRALLWSAVVYLWKPAPVVVPGERFVLVFGLAMGAVLVWEFVRRLKRRPSMS